MRVYIIFDLSCDKYMDHEPATFKQKKQMYSL